MTGPDDVQSLCRSRRRWRLACRLSWATFALAAAGWAATHATAAREAQARAVEAVREAEQLRSQAEGAQRQAREAAERADRLLYAQHIALALRELEQADAKAGQGRPR